MFCGARRATRQLKEKGNVEGRARGSSHAKGLGGLGVASVAEAATNFLIIRLRKLGENWLNCR